MMDAAGYAAIAIIWAIAAAAAVAARRGPVRIVRRVPGIARRHWPGGTVTERTGRRT